METDAKLRSRFGSRALETLGAPCAAAACALAGMAGRGNPLREPLQDHLAAEAARQAAEQEAWDAFRAAHPARFATQERTQQ